MKTHKKSRGHTGDQEGSTYCKAAANTGHQFAVQTHSRSQLVGSPQLARGLLNSPLLFAPSGAAVLQLARLEAQLALNQLSALSINNQHGSNPVALLGLLRAAAASTSASSPAVSMYRAQGGDFPRPRHLMPVAISQESNAISQEYQRSAFPPTVPEELDMSKYQRIDSGFRQDAPAVQGMCFPSRSSHDLGKAGGEDWGAEYKTPNTQHASSMVMTRTEPSWNSSRSVGDKCPSDSVGSLLASFGLSSEDLELLSRYPDSQLTPETLPLILQDIKGLKASRGTTVSPPHSQLPLLPPDSTPPTALHASSYLRMATQVPGKVIDYGHASQESFKRVPLPPSPTKHKVEPTVSSPEARKYLEHHRRSSPSLRSHRRTSHSPPTVKVPTPAMVNDYLAAQPRVYPHTCSMCVVQCEDVKDWHNHVNTVVHTAGCKDLRNQYPDWNPPGSSPWPRDRSPSQDGWSGHHGNRSTSRSASRSQSSCSSPGRSPPRHVHGHSRGPASRSQRWRSPQRHSSYRHTHSPPSHRLPHHAPPHHGRHGSPHGRQSHPRHNSSHIPTGGASARHHPHDRSWAPHDVTHRRSAGHPSSSSPSSSRSSSSSRTSKRRSSTSPGGDKARAPEKQGASIPGSSSMKGRSSSGSSPVSASTSLSTSKTSSSISFSAKTTQPPSSSPASSHASKTNPNAESADNKVVAAPVESKKADTANKQTETTEKLKWATDERGIVLISGLPESGSSESDLVNLAAPYGAPTEVILAPAEGKAVMVLPDRPSAQEMVNAPNTCISDCQLSMELLSVSADLSRLVTLFHAMMGPDKPCGALTAWNRLLVVNNVPDTPNGVREVQQLIQRFGNVNRSLVLNHNKIIFEMETAAIAQSVYKRFQKFPCIVQNNPLSFSMKPDVMLVKRTEDTKSDPTTSTLESPDCKASDTASSPDISQAPSGGQEVLSRNQTSVADQTDSATLGQEAEEQPASCQAGEDASASQAPMAVVVNGAEEIMASGTVEAPEEMAAKGNNATCTVEAPDTTLDLPKFTPAILQALLQECKSRSSQRAASESKGVEKEEAPSQHSSASPEKPTPMDADTKQEEDQEMEGDMEEEVSFEMDDFVTVDEVGDFTEEDIQPHEERQAGATRGFSATADQSEDTAAPKKEEEGKEERGESRVPVAGVHESRTVENVEDHTQNMESESCACRADVDSPDNQNKEEEKEEVITPGAMNLKDSLEEDTMLMAIHTDRFATMDIEVSMQRQEGEGEADYQKQDETSTTSELTEGPKRRRSPNKDEVAPKRIRKELTFPTHYILPPYNSSHPVGMEFLEPRMGFFCQVCAKFYSEDEEAKENHCRSVKHYDNLEMSLQRWRQKHSNGTSL